MLLGCYESEHTISQFQQIISFTVTEKECDHQRAIHSEVCESMKGLSLPHTSFHFVYFLLAEDQPAPLLDQNYPWE